MRATVLTFTQNYIQITSWMLYKSCIWQLDTRWEYCGNLVSYHKTKFFP